jgi:nicotinate phosphoribosyltransferase
VTAKAPIDGFGVGTALSTSYDAPALSGVYKLVETERNEVVVPTLKLSPGKETHPGPKQVWRVMSDGAASHDVVGQSQEETPDGLLQLVMEQGRRLLGDTSLRSHQVRCRDGVDQLPPSVTRLDDPDPYPVRISPALTALATTMRLRASQMGQDTGSE